MSDMFGTTALREGGVRATDAASASAVTRRANIFAMTQEAEDAVLSPREVGAFAHDMRAALAARIARLHGDDAAAASYQARMGGSEFAPLADPAHDGQGTPHAPLLAFVDKTAAAPKDIAAEDITALREAGVADADIVRLCELIAFMAYQLRVIAGLRLMGGHTA